MRQSSLHAHGSYRHNHPHRGAHRHLRHPLSSHAAASALADRVYRRLLAAQLVALAGTGVTTVALGLLAYQLGGPDAGAVLGAALALKMVAYVALSPVFAALAPRVDRRRMLISLDLLRAATLLALPFVTETWQVFVLVFIVSACAAGFTPAFQATLADVLPDQRQYTRALSLSRASYDLSDLLAPVLAAALLLALSFHALFALNAISFIVSAALIASVTLPTTASRDPLGDRTAGRILSGVRQFAEVPRLRGLLALNLVAAAASAMVIVNTVVIVRGELGLAGSSVAVALAVSAAGSLVAAAALPRILLWAPDRNVMLTGAVLLTIALTSVTLISTFAQLLAIWALAGLGLALVQTPAGRLLQRSGSIDQRAQLFAAQFALSHLCWLATYPIAGILGSAVGLDTVSLLLAAASFAATLAAGRLWRAEGPTTATPRNA